MWFFQKIRGKMEPFEAKSQLDNQQQHHPDVQSHSNPSTDDDNLLQVIAKDLENLVLSSKDDVIDQNIQLHSVVTNQEDQVKQQLDDNNDDDDVNEVVQVESSSGSEEAIERRRMENVLEADPEDSRVLDERETDLEIEVKDEDDFENNGEQRDTIGNESKSKGYHYPVRLDAEDCSYYIRTGMCKFGSSCKFNHPVRRKNQPSKETKKQQQQPQRQKQQSKKQKEEHVERHGQTECKQPAKETNRQKEENVERHGQTECKYHTSSAGCKYGKACKFNHGRGKTIKTPVVDYNFVGLPIRPGEKECPYYMRSGSCKYGPSCRFNHPDPTAVATDDAPTTYGNDGPLPLQPTPQPNIPNIPSWSAPRTPDPATTFVPMMYPPTQNMPPPNPDWNGYQAHAPVPPHLYPSSEQGLPIPPTFFLNNPPSNTNMYTHHQQPLLVSEYPERPGQPECSHFMKTGVCKYRASCKFHHPQSRISRTLRDKNICTYFSRHGTCKYGAACKYDHPVNYNSNSNPAGEGYDGSNGPEFLIQQSV